MRFRRSAQATAVCQAIGLMGITILGAGSVHAQNGDKGGDNLEPVVVSATRTEKPVSELARSVTVVDEQQIEEQASLDRNLGTILAKTVPGMGPSTEANSNFGQSLRGRNFLVLIDGIPQSTPLRDGFRDLNTIAPSSIERIEVIRGGTAVYGFGAAGGLVNIITKEPSDKPVAGYSQGGASFSTEETDDSGIYETEHRVSGTSDQWDYLLSGSYVERNGRFDSEGRRIPPNPLGSQGGFSDTDEFSLLGKAGYEFDGGDQRIEVMLNHFENEQDSDYTFGATGFTTTSDPTPNSRRTPAIRVEDAQPGSTALVDPGTENTTGNLTWLHRDLGGSQVRLNTYFGDQSVVFPRFPNFPQGEIESEKFGSRVTVNTPITLKETGATVIWGVDYLGDETQANRFGPGATSDVPDMDQDAFAVFGDLEVPMGDIGLLRGGVRHEEIEVDVGTVQSNQFGNTVTGGTLDYSETLFNLSSVFYLSESSEVFASYSQGFSIADIGRVIRDAGPFSGGATFSAEEFESDAEKVDNYELGYRFFQGPVSGSLIAFYSESDNGATFNQNLQIQKFSETIHGIEATLDYAVNRRTNIGGTFSWAEGESEDETGATQDLPNTRVSPEKLTGYVEYSPSGGWDNRLQVQAIGDRDPDTNQFGGGEVDGYTLVDFTTRYEVGPGAVRVSLSNLLNEDYYPAVNQAFDSSFAYAKGPGRRLGVSYAMEW
ncbi:TonB-dependent receptor [Halofilum ochraceum]|uniref:TonB-dependent receptor n=1 Tax=Halofilum ochraceum TaxID=1611323 RepID=UPI000829FD9E|nr:TonB-dependent receptor [Halofilum ochraceum]